jgi:hypothetical protein
LNTFNELLSCQFISSVSHIWGYFSWERHVRKLSEVVSHEWSVRWFVQWFCHWSKAQAMYDLFSSFLLQFLSVLRVFPILFEFNLFFLIQCSQLGSKCYKWIQKNQGCDHMTCRCGNQFCYQCGGKWPHKGACPKTPAPKPAIQQRAMAQHTAPRKKKKSNARVWSYWFMRS